MSYIADIIVRRTRASFHYAIRMVKRDEINIIIMRFAEAVIRKPGSRDLWSEARRMNGKCSITANSINGYKPYRLNEYLACVC